MEHQEEADSAKKVLDFYVNLVEKDAATLTFFLAENVVLDWFGKTVKQNRKVSFFVQDQVCSKITHHFSNIFPVEKVGFKETHQVKVTKEESLVISPPPASNNLESTPPRQSQPSTQCCQLVGNTASTSEIGQGDGLHNCTFLSPPKKIKLGSGDENVETIESEGEITKLKYITAEGFVEFRKPSSKKLQTETKWKRPVKLHLGYTSSSFKDCTIYLIIYEGNLKCRRNLMKEFCESEANTKSSV